MRLLLTGATGFVGRNILPPLMRNFTVVAPTRGELNLLDEDPVKKFVDRGNFDIVVHSANPTPAKNQLDYAARMTSDSLRIYFNLRRCCSSFGRMFYFGSGAEYDKRRDICSVTEDQIGDRIPADDYGFAKFLMNEDARHSDNVVNLRLFGCYGPTDAKGKFIRDAIDCSLENRPITIRQDCYFDYLFVDDIAAVISAICDKPLARHDYNLCSGRRIALSEIAKIVARQMGNPFPTQISAPGLNREYTASNSAICAELPGLQFTSIDAGINKQILWQKNHHP